MGVSHGAGDETPTKLGRLIKVPSEVGDADEKPQQGWGCWQGSPMGLGVLIRDPHGSGGLIKDLPSPQQSCRVTGRAP